MKKYSLILIQPYNDLKNHYIEFIENFKSIPLALLRITSLTPKNYNISIIDENVEKIIYKKVDLVGISIHGHVVAKRAYEIADRYQRLGVKVIIGGLHSTYFPDECLKHSDSVVIGEVEKEWKNILRDFENNRLKKIYTCKKPDISTLPLFDVKYIKNKKYDFFNLIQTTRGCPYGCSFCVPYSYYGEKIRHRNIDEILEEVRIFKKNKKNRFLNNFFLFTDDNMISDKKYAKSLFAKLISKKIKWGAQCSINIAKDDELLKLAYISGCRALFIGFESLNQDSLGESKKKFKTEDYLSLIKKIRKIGIYIYGSFVFGFDHDNPGVFKNTLNFCKKNIDFANFHILTPYFGTSFYEKLVKEKRLNIDGKKIDREWTFFRPKNISRKLLRNGIFNNYKKFYSLKSILLRVMRAKTKHMILLLIINLSFRKKIKNVKKNKICN